MITVLLKEYLANPTELFANQKALRIVFALAFGVQVVVAGFSGIMVVLIAPSITMATVYSKQLAWFSIATVFLGLVVAGITGGKVGKFSVLNGTIIGGVVLAAPAWYLTLAIISGVGRSPVVWILALQLVIAFGVGLVLVNFLVRAGRFARQ